MKRFSKIFVLSIFALFCAIGFAACGGGGDAATVPTAPQNFTAAAGDSQVVLSWAAPSSDGGSAITKYEVRKDSDAWITASNSTGHIFTGLTNGTEHTFKVRAVNAKGNGTEATSPATPSVTPSEGLLFALIDGETAYEVFHMGDATDTNIVIPAFYEGLPVKGIGHFAFAGCNSLKSIVIPASVTSLGDGAFMGCTSLGSITIPEGVTSISAETFYGCTGLTSITILEGVTSIGGGAFYGCTSLGSIIIPEGVTSIGSNAFEGCTSLDSITFESDSLEDIGNFAFDSCKSLKSIVISAKITSVSYNAFNNCTGLTDVYFKGTAEQWDIMVAKPTFPESVTLHFNYTGE